MAYEKLNRRIEETRCKGRIAEIEEEMARLTTQLLYWQDQLKRLDIAEQQAAEKVEEYDIATTFTTKTPQTGLYEATGQ